MRLLFFKAFIRSYLRLIYFDIFMLGDNKRQQRNYSRLLDKARQRPVVTLNLSQEQVTQIIYAMDMACIWYRKEVLCFQRAAATSTVLRDYGQPAEMVTGTQLMPHKTHAWVEIGGSVANDKPYMREKYFVMEQLPGVDLSEVLI